MLVKPCHPHHSKVSQHVNLLRRLSWFLPPSLLVLYLKLYILPCVDYCDVVWDCCSNQDTRHCLTTPVALAYTVPACPLLLPYGMIFTLHMQKASPCSTHVQMLQLPCPSLSISLFPQTISDTPPATAT